MYTTSWCPYCARARKLFDDKGVKYTDIDVEAVAGARCCISARFSSATAIWAAMTTPARWIGAANSIRCWPPSAAEHNRYPKRG
jgi:Glutaredoxin